MIIMPGMFVWQITRRLAFTVCFNYTWMAGGVRVWLGVMSRSTPGYRSWGVVVSPFYIFLLRKYEREETSES